MKYLENFKYILMLYVEKIKGNVQNFEIKEILALYLIKGNRLLQCLISL